MMSSENQLLHLIIIGMILLVTIFPMVAEGNHADLQLVSDVQAFSPGFPFWVGLYFNIDKGWHIYWKNPGDSGLAPKVKWDLPPGFSIGELLWPYPEKIIISGIANFGYEDEVLLMAQVVPPADLPPGQNVSLKLNAEWLICREMCIPEDSLVEIILPVRQSGFVPDPKWLNIFNKTRDNLPISISEWKFRAYVKDNLIYLTARYPANGNSMPEHIRFFPYEEQVYDYASTDELLFTSNGFTLPLRMTALRVSNPERVSGILVSDVGWRGLNSERALEIDVAIENENGKADSVGPLIIAIIYAIAGGIFLNIMPSVLAVFSLLVLRLKMVAGTGQNRPGYYGLFFTAGIMVAFGIMACIQILLGLESDELKWGWQLQSSGFNFMAVSLLFLLGLSYFNVFDLGLLNISSKEKAVINTGFTAYFASGIITTIAATPFTVVFIDSAFGFAVTQPAYISIIIFSFIGLGLASPYLFLTIFPGLLKYVPKPGSWTDSLKQLMAFLLMGTVIWLLWKIGLQNGLKSTLVTLIVLFCLATGGWIYGRWLQTSRRSAAKRAGFVILILSLACITLIGLYHSQNAALSATDGHIKWEPFVAEQVESIRASGQHVFVNFTADWCLGGELNERTVFEDPAVIKKFADLKIRSFKADWTFLDGEITAALANFRKTSIPLYVLYTAGSKEEHILPEILTPGILLDSLGKLDNM